MMEKTLFWHRRDFRIADNAGLYNALKQSKNVQSVFVFDTTILHKLPRNDQRILFIHQEIAKLKAKYREIGADLLVLHGDPKECILATATQLGVDSVFTNRDYEPYAKERDTYLFEKLAEKNISFHGSKDQVIFEKSEVVKPDGKPYSIFTPYSKKWKEKLNSFYLKPYPTEKYLDRLVQRVESPLPTIEELGFETKLYHPAPEREVDLSKVKKYSEQRDIPSLEGTSKLSVHLRFGTISIRSLAKTALETNETFLNELIWRDFYQAILYHYPHTAADSFRKEYDQIEWLNDEKHYQLWCEGKTGYALVDAGMRELNETGFMHNRVRMVVASFLCKHLLIDWRWGATYFAEKLLDFDLASNTGGWQWAAGCGCDAAPYFRVFNPTLQQKRFDPKLVYTKKWVPEYGTRNYPQPIVEHKMARERAVNHYKKYLVKS